MLREKIRHGVQHSHSTRTGLFWTLTLEMAIAYRKAYIDWCEKSMHLLEESILDGGGALEEAGLPCEDPHEHHHPQAG